MKKPLVLFSLILFMLSSAFAAGTAFAKYRAGKSVPLPLSVSIRKVGIPEGADYLYDGAVHGIEYDSSRMSLEGVSESVEAGTYEAVFSLKDPVTECWEDRSREAKTVILRIVPRPIVLTSGSAKKAWDGTPLTEGSYTLSPGTLPEGSFRNVPEGTVILENALSEGDHLESVQVTGSQQDAGSSGNVIGDARILGPSGRSVTENYDISYVYGELTVEPVPIDLPEDAVYKWNGSEHEISYLPIKDALSEAVPSGVTVLDAQGNDVTGTVSPDTYFDGTSAFRIFGTGAWNQTWTVRMMLRPDGNHYWSVPLHGEVTDARTVTLQILPELGNARDVIIAATDSSMVDGFSASGFAGLLSAPIIGVTRGAASLSEEEWLKIARLTSQEGARLWIMGGTGAVSAGIEAELRSKIGDPEYHVTAVSRIAGIDRYNTAWQIYRSGHGSSQLTEASWNESGTVIILPGGNVEPTLSIMTYAYATRTPVLLAQRGVLQDYYIIDERDGVPGEAISVADMLREAHFIKAILVGPSSGVSSTFISEACEDQLRMANPSVEIMRLSGGSIGAVTNAICAWMESHSPSDLSDPNVQRTGRYSYIRPEADPWMMDSGRMVNISDYKAIFSEIDALGNSHLYVRTSAQLPYRYTLTLSDGDPEGEPVLQGWMSDDSVAEVYFGNVNGSPLMTFRPEPPSGYVLAGFGAAWVPGRYSYSDGLLSMTLGDSYLVANGRTRQAVLYAIYVEEGKDPSNRANYLRYKGSSSGGSYEKTLSDASDCRIVIPAE